MLSTKRHAAKSCVRVGWSGSVVSVGFAVTPPTGRWGRAVFEKAGFIKIFFYVKYVLYVNSCIAVFAMSLQHQAKADRNIFLNLAQNVLTRMYLSAFLTSGLDGVVGRRHVLAAVALQGKTRGSY